MRTSFARRCHWHPHDMATAAEFEVAAGRRVPFVLTHAPSHIPAPEPIDAEHAITDTERYWTDWISRCDYRGPWATEVRQSLVVLKALTYAPTGGIVAAATTSLPERLGGPRNWDYRYCWLRDAAFTLQATPRHNFSLSPATGTFGQPRWRPAGRAEFRPHWCGPGWSLLTTKPGAGAILRTRGYDRSCLTLKSSPRG